MWPKLIRSALEKKRPRDWSSSEGRKGTTMQLQPSSSSSPPGVGDEYRKAMCKESDVELRLPTNATSSDDHASSPALPLPFLLYRDPIDVTTLLDSVASSTLRSLLLDFFETTLYTSQVCASLIRSLHLVRSNHSSLLRILHQTTTAAPIDLPLHLSSLTDHAKLENPLSAANLRHFHRVHCMFTSLAKRTASYLARLTRRLKLLRRIRSTSIWTIAVAASALSLSLIIVLATHGFAVGVVAVCMFLIPIGQVHSWRPSRLSKLRDEADVTAKGCYIVSRDLDTMSRMIVRLQDEMEHEKKVVGMFVRSGGEEYMLREVVRELRGEEEGLTGLLEELEEHIYWFLDTIHTVRHSVADGIAAASMS